MYTIVFLLTVTALVQHMRKPRELKCGDILKRGDIRIKDIKGGFRKDDLVPRESLLEHNQK
jgi:hypothetical protein